MAGVREDKAMEKNIGEDGVSVAVSAEENRGRWYAGMPSPNPKGRPTKAKEQATLSAITNAIPPEKIAGIIEGLINHPTSWRAQQAGLELHLAYTLGKPVQRIQQSEGGLSSVLDELGE